MKIGSTTKNTNKKKEEKQLPSFSSKSKPNKTPSTRGGHTQQDQTTKKINLSIQTISQILFYTLIILSFFYIVYQNQHLQTELLTCHTQYNTLLGLTTTW